MNAVRFAPILALSVLFSLACTLDFANARIIGINDPPNITIYSPVNGTQANDAFLNFSVGREREWFHGRMLVSFTEQIDGNLCRSVEVNHDLKSSSFNYSATLENLSEGIHSLRVTLTYTEVIMESHHIKYQPRISSSTNISFTLDTTAPSISIQSFVNQANNGTLIFTVNDPATWITYSLDNMTSVIISGNTTIPNIPNGAHKLQISAADSAGNIGTSKTLSFDIEPFSDTFAIVVMGASALTVGVILLVYLQKHRHQKLPLKVNYQLYLQFAVLYKEKEVTQIALTFQS